MLNELIGRVTRCLEEHGFHSWSIYVGGNSFGGAPRVDHKPEPTSYVIVTVFLFCEDRSQVSANIGILPGDKFESIVPRIRAAQASMMDIVKSDKLVLKENPRHGNRLPWAIFQL